MARVYERTNIPDAAAFAFRVRASAPLDVNVRRKITRRGINQRDQRCVSPDPPRSSAGSLFHQSAPLEAATR